MSKKKRKNKGVSQSEKERRQAQSDNFQIVRDECGNFIAFEKFKGGFKVHG